MYTIGKQTPKYNDKTKGESFLFTLNITSTFVDTFTINLFNVVKSVVTDGTTQNGIQFKPFTINDTEFIVAGTSNVGIQTNGSLNYKNFGAATNLTVSTPTGQNLTYRDIFSMISAGQYLQLTRMTITSTLKAQLTSGTMNVLNISNTGVVNRKSVPLVTFFDATQNQNNTLDVFINTHLCYNQGLEFTILPLSTATFQFYLEV
jgi:hypothetical protein